MRSESGAFFVSDALSGEGGLQIQILETVRALRALGSRRRAGRSGERTIDGIRRGSRIFCHEW